MKNLVLLLVYDAGVATLGVWLFMRGGDHASSSTAVRLVPRSPMPNSAMFVWPNA